MVLVGSALFRYYNRLPSTGSSDASGMTPPALKVGSLASSSESVLPCTESIENQVCSESQGMSVCNKPRKRKGNDQSYQTMQRRRSNPAVRLISVDALHETRVLPTASDSVVEVIPLASDGSNTVLESKKPRRNRKGNLPVLDDVDEYSDDEFVPNPEAPKKKSKKSYDATRKFQDTWAAKLPWAELFRGADGLYEYVKCTVCSTISGKPKIMGPKWDTLFKHGSKRKATKNLGNGVKKGQWYIAQNCKHLRFERIFAARSTVTVAQQLAVVKGERARKRQQLATVLHLLQEGRPMLEYSALKPLFTFLGVPTIARRHWSDGAGWELAECLYHQVQKKTKEVMQAARFFSITCNEVTTLDTQSWISIHRYVCQDWTRKPMLLSLERITEGTGSDNLTTVIVDAIKNCRGVERTQLHSRFASFGADGVSTFQGKRTGVVKQLKEKFAPRVAGIHCMAHRTNLAVEALSDLPVVARIEEMLGSLYAFFAHSPKRHLEFVKLAEVMQSKGLKILKNIQTRWISMLSPAVRVMNEYRVLLVKMSMDSKIPQKDNQGKKAKKDKKLLKLAQKNLSHLTDIQILLGLSGLLPLLRCVHSLMQFAQGREVFVCDYVSAIQICIAEMTAFYVDENTAFSQDIFWDFKALIKVKHDAIPMSWVQSALDLNSSSEEHLYFSPTGHMIQAFHRHGESEEASPVSRSVFASTVEDVKDLCKGAAQKLIAELEGRFPTSSLMDAFGLVYPQYWLVPEADQNFERHLKVLKERYCYTRTYGASQSTKKRTIASPSSEPNLETDQAQEALPVLSLAALDEQAFMFKLAMKENCHVAMEGDLPLNPLTRLWRRLEANGLLRHKLSEYMKIAKLAVFTVLGSVEDERTFSTLSFMKNKLRNRLSSHLPLVVGMHAQEFYGIEDFPYDVAYEEWRTSTRRDD